eukprot:1662282-Prymnesium_polylepis.1
MLISSSIRKTALNACSKTRHVFLYFSPEGSSSFSRMFVICRRARGKRAMTTGARAGGRREGGGRTARSPPQ